MNKEFTAIDASENEIKLATKIPTFEDFEESDKAYGYKIASLIKESGKKKLLLRQELEKFLKDQNIWTENDQKQLNSMQSEIEKIVSKLNKGGIKLSEGRSLALEVMEKRSQMFELLRKRQMFDNTTIEASAEQEKTDYLIYTCTVDAATGEKYWQSFEDAKNDKNTDVYNKASINAIKLIYGVDTEIERQFPETQWLLKYKFIDNDLNYIDRKTGEFVDKNGNSLKKKEAVNATVVEEAAPFIDDETNEPVIA